MKTILTTILILSLFSCKRNDGNEKKMGADPIDSTELSKVQVVTTAQGLNRRPKPVPPVDTIVVTLPPVIIVPPPTLPSSHILVMPPVINQGSEGSCNSVCVSYQRSYEAYKKQGAISYSQSTNILSPEYLFNQVKSSTTCSGSALLMNLNFVRDNGICTWASMPYTWTGCSLQPTVAQTLEASKFRITSYSQIYASDITAIKTMLAANRPLVSQYSVDQSFLNADTNFVWKTFTTWVGVHGMVLCGYDDSKNAFLVENSWGVGWGNKGYCWIDYNFLKNVSSNLLVMNL